MKHPAHVWKTHFAAVATALLAALAPALAQPTQQAYVKASNTGPADVFGYSVAISGDTMVVGALFEQSDSRGVNGNGTNDNSIGSGAAYVYVRNGSNWIQQAYLKASNADPSDFFGISVAISGDTIVVGALGEKSYATGVNGNQSDNSGIGQIGAAYVFVREGTNWTQQAYLKPSYIRPNVELLFGLSVTISGNTIVVGARNEWGGSTGVNGIQTNANFFGAGAAYVFAREGTNWTQQAYLKASNTEAQNFFGWSVAISGDTIIVGAPREKSSATGVNGNQTQDTGAWYGAAYIFVRNGTNWSQQAYLKASGWANTLGMSVTISGDTAVVWANNASSTNWAYYFTGINPLEDFNHSRYGSVAYIFVRNGTNWTQQAFIKPAYLGSYFLCDAQVSLSGNTLVIGNIYEASAAAGINGDENDQTLGESGAAWVYVRRGTNWMRKAYLKASNNNAADWFGYTVAVSGDTVVVGSAYEDSAAKGINGNQNNNSAEDSGAAYVFTGFNHGPELSMTPDGTGGFFLRFNAIENLSYHLERSPNVNGPWTTNATFSALVTAPIEFHDTNAPPGQAFYRVAQQ